MTLPTHPFRIRYYLLSFVFDLSPERAEGEVLRWLLSTSNAAESVIQNRSERIFKRLSPVFSAASEMDFSKPSERQEGFSIHFKLDGAAFSDILGGRARLTSQEKTPLFSCLFSAGFVSIPCTLRPPEAAFGRLNSANVL